MADRPVIVLGAGGHAKVVVDLLRALGKPIAMVVEPMAPGRQGTLLGVPVRGGDDAVLAHDPSAVDLALGIGMTAKEPVKGLAARRAEAARFEARGYGFPPLVHPGAIVGSECTLGAGAQIMAGAVLQPCCVIAPFAIINTRSSVDHDCIIGEGAHIAPGATLGGNVRIGSETLVGIGTTVLQSIRIGAHSIVAGGAMAIRDIGDGERWAGVPARRVS